MTGQQLISQLKTKWLGKYVNYDGVEGYQCVDLAKEGITEATGLRCPAMGDAITWYSSPSAFLKSVATEVLSSNAIAGDLVIKRPNHVGWATGNVSATQVEILEQNGHTGDGKQEPGNEVRTRWINRSDIACLWRLHVLVAPLQAHSSVVGKQIHLPADSGNWHLYHETGPYAVTSGQWITVLHPSSTPAGYTYPIVGDEGNGIYVINSPRWGRGALYTKGSKFTIS